MRLINAETLEFEEFFRDRPPRMYYILSHRWSEDEMTYRDFKKGRRKSSQGYAKVTSYCSFARERHQVLKTVREQTPVYMRRPHMETFDSENDSEVDIVPENEHEWPPCYVWIDTCCIDKSSSAELSEAINSMYHYYAGATECHAFLIDVTGSVALSSLPGSAKSTLLDQDSEYISNRDQDKIIAEDLVEEQDAITQLCSSIWFSRGWTLQELLAPKVVVFVDAQWKIIGHKRSKEPFSSIQHHPGIGHNLNAVLEKITGIDKGYLERPASVKHASVARRMSWASQRQVTRIEDQAYCLLGIFNVHMPLLYGERRMAFQRLQEEIVKRSADQSIFAWRMPPTSDSGHPWKSSSIFAPSPKRFADGRYVLAHTGGPRVIVGLETEDEPMPYALTNLGLQTRTEAQAVQYKDGGLQKHGVYTIKLNCVYKPDDNDGNRVEILVHRMPAASVAYRQAMNRLHVLDQTALIGTRVGPPEIKTFFASAFDSY